MKIVLRRLNVSIIEREEDLFLCRLMTLREWKAAVFYKNNEIMFDETKNRV